MTNFSQAVIDKDFTKFYESLSKTFKVRQNMAMMNNAFGYFIDSGIDLSPLKGADPVFDTIPKLEAGTVGSSSGFGARGGGARGGFGGSRRGGTGFEARSSGRLLLVLTASGTFPFEPEPVKFTFRYRYQHPDWKIHNLHVDVPGARERAAQQTSQQ